MSGTHSSGSTFDDGYNNYELYSLFGTSSSSSTTTMANERKKTAAKKKKCGIKTRICNKITFMRNSKHERCCRRQMIPWHIIAHGLRCIAHLTWFSFWLSIYAYKFRFGLSFTHSFSLSPRSLLLKCALYLLFIYFVRRSFSLSCECFVVRSADGKM